MDMLDDNGVAFELNLVIVPSRAFDVTATVRIGMMSELDTFGRALQGRLGLDRLGLSVRHGLVCIGQRFASDGVSFSVRNGAVVVSAAGAADRPGSCGCIKASKRMALSITVSSLYDNV